jgi:hypothetical protein
LGHSSVHGSPSELGWFSTANRRGTFGEEHFGNALVQVSGIPEHRGRDVLSDADAFGTRSLGPAPSVGSIPFDTLEG